MVKVVFHSVFFLAVICAAAANSKAQEGAVCSASDLAIAQTAQAEAATAIDTFARFVEGNDGPALSAVTKWLGVNADPKDVVDTLRGVGLFLPSVSFRCIYANSGEMVVEELIEATGETVDVDRIGSTFAYVYPGNLFVVFLLRRFFEAPTSGADTQLGTLVHEVSHFTMSGATDDMAYGPENALGLAMADSEKAQRNADNYQYLLEDWLFGP